MVKARLTMSVKKLIWILVWMAASYATMAQGTPRRAFLGAQVEAVKDGLKVVAVAGGTAQLLKLEAGDVVQQINGEAVADMPGLVALLARYRAGDEVTMKVLRKGQVLNPNGKFAARPAEQVATGELLYDDAPYKGGKLRVLINKPSIKAKLPAMLFIPGYTCSSIDNLPDVHPYKRIVDAYVKAGFVTLRIEKSGLGDSYNTPACESTDLYDEINSFEAGLIKLKSLPYVDTTKIIIVGHSMGGIVAPALSARHKVAGVVVYGTSAKSWFEYQLELYRVQNLLAGMDPLSYEKSVVDQYDLNYRFFINKEKLADLAKNPRNDSLLKVYWQYDGNGRIYGRNAEYWRQVQDVNHVENWKNTTAKVLVQFGESDFQAFSKADHEQIVRTVNHYHPGNARLITFPETDHYFAKSGTMQQAYDKFSRQQIMQLFNEYNPEVGNSAVKWSLGVVGADTVFTTKTWSKLKTQPYAGKQDDIWFINENTGWYVNGYGRIFRTTDGGTTWQQMYENKGTFFRTLAFLDEKTGFAGTVGTDYFPGVTDTIPLYRTDDGGATWKPVSYTGPYVKGLCAIDVVKEPFINHGVNGYRYHIYAVGRVGGPANMLVSHDGGATWQSKPMNETAGMLFDIKMLDTKTGFACAASSDQVAQSNALILKTRDGGKTWRKVYQSTRPFETTWKAAFPTEKIGYVTIQSYNPDPTVKQQRIAKTTDGGETWTEMNLTEDAAAREFGIGFIDENHGFAGTMNSGFETKDGGKTWQKTDLGRACNKIRFYRRADGTTYGYAIGVDVFKW